ncbi:MAG: hypothetical protein COW88_00585 [Candidatus Lloydbacteria bacterium CG22_combo_CG10-13_8_21_14_all_47_15]|uniref:Uncharacterized protein n=1 Tax=Candidatus Lloydbacteria bacterium CG22_combo_CG10-13_8_21_14_all_47_15 TaxID=1974635 RepID=A0A2H0CWP1_9BACT|nr:MAG: hypothetical protein COW88_00585 [Candidatus Lloydbacteria bacterium CG22_combo_CG10-13_8_21_14_all_47_15]
MKATVWSTVVIMVLCILFIGLLGGNAFAQSAEDNLNMNLSEAPDAIVVVSVECRVEKRAGKDAWQYYIITKDGAEFKMRKTWPPKFSWDSSGLGPSEGRPVVTGRHMNKIVFSSYGEIGSFMHHGGVKDCVPSTHEHSGHH